MQPELMTDAERVLGRALPGRRNEAWKWTDMRTRMDGHTGLIKACILEMDVPEGVTVHRVNSVEKPTGIMEELAVQFSPPAWVIEVPAGMCLDEPLRLRQLQTGHSRVYIKIGAGARFSVLETYGFPDKGFANMSLDIELGTNAYLQRCVLQTDKDAAVRVLQARVRMHDSAQLHQYSLSFGSEMSRLETHIEGCGAAISAALYGGYILSDKAHVDMTSHIDIRTRDAQIVQAIKGVADDQASGVFQGKFHVHESAQKTDAQMRHDALLLSERAHIRAKPELEIYADDVTCAHGNTIGSLDAAALFYMRQRGLPLAQARALLVEAFIIGMFEGLTDNALHELIVGKIRHKLDTLCL